MIVEHGCDLHIENSICAKFCHIPFCGLSPFARRADDCWVKMACWHTDLRTRESNSKGE